MTARDGDGTGTGTRTGPADGVGRGAGGDEDTSAGAGGRKVAGVSPPAVVEGAAVEGSAVEGSAVEDSAVEGAAVETAAAKAPADPAATAGAATKLGADEASRRAAMRAETMRQLERMHALPEGDPERERLRDAVIKDHMAYARHIATRYGGRGELAEDFVQVAYLGLVKAVDNFDPEHGTGFLGYATPVVIGEIKRYFRDATWDVHVPRRMQELSGSLRKASEELTRELGRSPTVPELAEKLGAQPEEILEAFDAAEVYNTSSLDQPVGSPDEGAALADFLGDHDPGFDAVVNREALKGALTKLPERDKRILLMRYFRGMTQSQIGDELGVSQMQVSRLLKRILDELRVSMG